MMADAGDLHPMFQEMLRRSDGWTNNVNESSLDYDFITRHPAMSFIFLTLTGLAMTVGNVGNILVIGAVLSYKRLTQNSGNLFIVNLAIADLCITSIVSPMNMIGVIKGPRFYLDKVMLCNFLGSICTVSCIVSVLSIAAVAVNRVVCICKYFLYRTIYSRKKTLFYCLSLWVIAILLDLPNWVGWGGHTFGLKEMGCTMDRIASHAYSIFLGIAATFIPMIIVLVSYLCIFMYVRKSRKTLARVSGRKNLRVKGNSKEKSHTATKEDLQLAFTLFLTFLVFLLCWSTYMLAMIFDYKDEWPKEVYVIGTLLGHANSCLNSIIYAMCNKRFRQGYYVFVHKLFCLEIKKESILKALGIHPSKRRTSKTSQCSTSTCISVIPPPSEQVEETSVIPPPIEQVEETSVIPPPIDQVEEKHRLYHLQLNRSMKHRLYHLQLNRSRKHRLYMYHLQLNRSMKHRLYHLQLNRSRKHRLYHIRLNRSRKHRLYHLRLNRSRKHRLHHLQLKWSRKHGWGDLKQ